MTGRSGQLLASSVIIFTQLGVLLHSCTSLYMSLSLSQASPWGSSEAQGAGAPHCETMRTIQARSSASCHDQTAHKAFLLGGGLDSDHGENQVAFWGL